MAGEAKMDPVSGMRGLKQILKCLIICRKGSLENEEPDETFERHSAHFLERCFPGWIGRNQK